ncbi:MAG: type II toxin-antitoxin system HipA family toxin, partial [Desulfohalobiaceae bacterium]
MTRSDPRPPREAYVWIWLPGATDPVVAGKLTAEGKDLLFNYGRSYLEKQGAISLYDEELPLRPGVMLPRPGLHLPGCIRDASPDAWGRRVLMNVLLGQRGNKGVDDLDELTCLLESGSDRIGALDFQRSAREYVPRDTGTASLDELLNLAERVEKGAPLSRELDQAFRHGTSIGGARPKAAVRGEKRRYIAKFSSSTDTYSVVKAEYVAMRLAALCGLDTAPVRMTRALDRDVLLVERFDRVATGAGMRRRMMLSALTILGLGSMTARYASYQDLAEIIRHRFTDAAKTLEELFCRMVFNILCGNTDDHARNHAAFWDGTMLSLTPAFDICPQRRTGNEASQAMLISGQNRMSRISACLEGAHHFLLSPQQARAIVEHQIQAIGTYWCQVCDEARVSQVDRN